MGPVVRLTSPRKFLWVRNLAHDNQLRSGALRWRARNEKPASEKGGRINVSSSLCSRSLALADRGAVGRGRDGAIGPTATQPFGGGQPNEACLSLLHVLQRNPPGDDRRFGGPVGRSRICDAAGVAGARHRPTPTRIAAFRGSYRQQDSLSETPPTQACLPEGTRAGHRCVAISHPVQVACGSEYAPGPAHSCRKADLSGDQRCHGRRCSGGSGRADSNHGGAARCESYPSQLAHPQDARCSYGFVDRIPAGPRAGGAADLSDLSSGGAAPLSRLNWSVEAEFALRTSLFKHGYLPLVV